MLNSKFKIIFLFFAFYLLLTTLSVQAALVPCGPGSGGPSECQFCHFYTLINRVINFALYYIAIPIVAVMVAWGGIKIMTAGESTDKVAEGRKIIQAAIIGVLIALGAWMLLNTILSVLTGSGFNPWEWGGKNPFKC